jgi:hypothetical protein
MIPTSSLVRAPLVIAVLVITTNACSSGTTTALAGMDGGAPATPDAGGGAACGLAFTGPKWTASCQSWSDQYCCNQQKACAANAACAQLIACIDACPSPRKDPCINACTPDGGSAVDLLDAFGSCSKSTPSGGPEIPSSCEWPTGG